MKILFASPNQISRWNNIHQLFRNEIAKFHDVTWIGPGYDGSKAGPYFIEQYLTNHPKPDVIMTYSLKYTQQFRELNLITDIPKVHFVCDLTPPYRSAYKTMLDRDQYDLMFPLSRRVLKITKEWGFRSEFLPFGVDIDRFRRRKIKKIFDVGIPWNEIQGTYPNRTKIRERLSKGPITIYKGRSYHDAYVNILNQSRILINSLSAWGSLNTKPFEVMACGGFLLTERFEEFSELGLKDETHCVLFDGLEDVSEKVKFYLKQATLRNSIARKGCEFVRKYHTNAKRVEVMNTFLDKLI